MAEYLATNPQFLVNGFIRSGIMHALDHNEENNIAESPVTCDENEDSDYWEDSDDEDSDSEEDSVNEEGLDDNEGSDNEDSLDDEEDPDNDEEYSDPDKIIVLD